ncbi:MAG: hypothetical protein FWC70_07685 [Defluviitaleaceae bacterium]|nr:hypothetical protein [Defluviitaleaceae bacterium]
MTDLIKRFRANAPRREQQKKVNIEGVELTIAPMSYIDRMRISNTLKRESDGSVIVRGDEAARENLCIAATYALEFKLVKPETLNELGCDSTEQFVEGTLSHVGIGQLFSEILDFTLETQKEHDDAMSEAADTASD